MQVATIGNLDKEMHELIDNGDNIYFVDQTLGKTNVKITIFFLEDEV